MLKKIDSNIASHLKAQQYIHSTYLIIKELIENSLDANSSCIKIIVDEKSIIIEDNGFGISDLTNICQSGYTSKEDTTYRVLGVHYSTAFSHGFRGQALFSIKEQSDIKITTKCKDWCLAKTLQFVDGHSNEIIETARENGTTFVITNIFKNAPIRKTFDQKKIKSSIMQIAELLRSFTFIYDVKFTFYYKNKLIFSDSGTSDIKKKVKEFDEVVEINNSKFDLFLFPISKKKETHFYLGKRVCKCTEVFNLIEKIFKKFYDYSPSYVIFFKTEADINISIDKTEVILKDNKMIMEEIRNEIYKHLALYSYVGERKGITDDEATSNSSNHQNKFPTRDIKSMSVESLENDSTELRPFNSLLGHKYDGNNDKILPSIEYKKIKMQHQETLYSTPLSHRISSTLNIEDKSRIPNIGHENLISEINHTHKYNDKIALSPIFEDQTRDCSNQDNAKRISNYPFVQKYLNKESSQDSQTMVVLEKSSINALQEPINELSKEYKQDSSIDLSNTPILSQTKAVEYNEIAPQNPIQMASAYKYISEDSLKHKSVKIQKTDFREMNIIGQFNHGFILATLVKENSTLLIVIDQHAADEIYRFELLKKTFQVKKQRLIHPIPLKIDQIQNLIIEDNMEIIEKNGFEMSDGKLTAIPMYQNILFDQKDFYALVEAITDGEIWSRKLINIMASKACRYSIMIGKHLGLKEMKDVLMNLSLLDKPWSCPHGRPTFKVLSEL